MAGHESPGSGDESSRHERGSKLAMAVAIGASLALAAIAFLASTRSGSTDFGAPVPDEAAAMAAFSMFDEP